MTEVHSCRRYLIKHSLGSRVNYVTFRMKHFMLTPQLGPDRKWQSEVRKHSDTSKWTTRLKRKKCPP